MNACIRVNKRIGQLLIGLGTLVVNWNHFNIMIPRNFQLLVAISVGQH